MMINKLVAMLMAAMMCAEPLPLPEAKTEYLGVMTITAYCGGTCCCGAWSSGYTADGSLATQGRTAAHNYLDFGTEIHIDGVGDFVIEDRGDDNMSDGMWVDIYFDSHQDALEFGVRQAEVWRKI